MEDALYEVESMRRFARIDLLSDTVPDETTICKFRHLLEAQQLTARMFDAVKALLEERKLLVLHGEAYARYRARVPGLIPWPGRSLSADEARTLCVPPPRR